MRPLYYILRGHTPVPVHPVVFARWFSEHYDDRHVADDYVGDPRTSPVVLISTIFLGLDHGLWQDDGEPPILFETMVFGGKLDQRQLRYSTWDEAEKGHAAMIEIVRKAEGVKA